MVKLSNGKLLIVIIGVVILGGGFVILWQKTQVPIGPLPSLPKVEVTPALPQPSYARYTLQASLPQIEKMAVYKYERATTRGRSYNDWSRALGFAGEPEELEDALEGTLYLWSKEGQTLVINEDASSLSYRVDLNDPTALTGSFLPTFEQAAGIVERTLTELGSTRGGFGDSSTLAHDPTKNRALKTGVSLVQETTLNEAELLETHFIAKIGDYPLYLESGPEGDPVLAWVGRDGKLLRLEYRPIGVLGEKIADYPLKNAEEILQDLDVGKGVVVDSDFSGGEEIVSTVITKVDLGYLLPQLNTTTIQPIFVLTGQARTQSGKTGTITIYLPAAR